MLLKTLSFFKKYIIEVLIIFFYILTINNYIGNVDSHINSDGIGYYDYLPSIFVFNDFNRTGYSNHSDSTIYSRVNHIDSYVKYEDKKVNKYSCGTALLEMPFFLYVLNTTNNTNIYSKPFQKTIFHSSIFYLFLSLLFLKRLLYLYNINRYVILLCQFSILFSTSITHYSNFDAGFSHVYSLFAILGFLFYTKIFFNSRSSNHLIYASIFLGLVFLLRPPNILILLFIPFLAGSFNQLRGLFRYIISSPKPIILGLTIFVTICSLQLFAWFFQTGHFIIYSYQGESFNFSSPQILNILFSYKKGLFIYTPLLFLCSILGVSYFIFKKKWYLLITWSSFFFILTYFLSSWWSWFYGCSYGLRAYLEFYPIFFIVFALFLNHLNLKYLFIFSSLILLTSYINIIQTYQYKEYILHWIDMDKEKYWKVFLKTDKKYEGLLWKESINKTDYLLHKREQLGKVYLPLKIKSKAIYTTKSNEVHNFNEVEIIQIGLKNSYKSSTETKIRITIADSTKTYYQSAPNIIHFHKTELDLFHSGVFNYNISNILKNVNQNITVEIESTKEIDTIENITISYFSKKK